MAYFLEINGKGLIMQGVKKILSYILCIFFAIFEGPSRETEAASSNQFLKFIK